MSSKKVLIIDRPETTKGTVKAVKSMGLEALVFRESFFFHSIDGFLLNLDFPEAVNFLPKLVDRKIIAIMDRVNYDKINLALEYKARVICHRNSLLPLLNTCLNFDCYILDKAVKDLFLANILTPSNNLLSEFDLRPDEIKLIEQAASGKTNPEIAKQINKTESTIKMYMSQIYMKLGLNSRQDLKVFAIKAGLIKV